MIPNGKIPKNKITPVSGIQEEELEIAGNELKDSDDELQQEERHIRGKIKHARRISTIGTTGRVRLGFTRWRKAAQNKANKEVGYQRASTSGLSKLRAPNKLNYHRMNAAQLSDLEDLVDGSLKDKHKGKKGKNGALGTTSISSSSRALLYYFAKLSANSNESEVIDLDFVDTLIKTGASLGTTDRHGQTIMHEAARQWEVEVARFLIERGASINQADRYGRTPLHVAAAVDYPDMVKFLVDSGADIHAHTETELQTPTHFAARNDAVNSLKMLLKCGAHIDDRDYKQRTPLQVAAELDRSETAKLLVRQGADAGVIDDSGMTVLVMMISKMPTVAKEALNQFYSRDRANRKQYFYLNYLEPAVPKCMSSGCARTALEVVILHKQFELIMHPVFQRFIQVKWERFGKKGAWLQVITSLVFVILWTLLGITKPNKVGDYYYPLSKTWWRIGLAILAVLLTLNEIRREIVEYYFSKKEHRLWVKWRETELQRDMEHCHPRWPGERLYLMQEIDALHHQEPSYLKDAWNVFDWLTFIAILATIITHTVSLFSNHLLVQKAHINLMCMTLIFLWIRLLKNFRAFTALGPFVVMLSHLVFDVLKFAFLFIVFYIPYAASFWMVFASHNVSGYTEIPDLLFSMFRMTVVDDYNYDALAKAEPIMSKILCGTYIALSAVICLNLFIALMSDTFQRVYDNVKANAVMQQASTILMLENNLSVSKRRKFADFIHTRCSPDELYYDDDIVDNEEGDLKRMTHQIKEELEEVHNKLNVQPQVKQENQITEAQTDVDQLRGDVLRLERQQQALTAQFHTQIGEIKEMLREITAKLNRRKKRAVQPCGDIPQITRRNLETL